MNPATPDHRGDSPGKPFNWSGLVAALTGFPGLAEHLRAVHVPDRTGHCKGCVQYQKPPEKSPCRLRDVADTVLAIRPRR